MAAWVQGSFSSTEPGNARSITLTVLFSLELLTISQLKQAVLQERIEARIHGQVQTLTRKTTRDSKPYWEVVLADAETKVTLRAWSDSPAFSFCDALALGAFLEAAGEFVNSAAFGPEAKRWTCRELDEEEREALLGGPPALREKQAADFAAIEGFVHGIADPRLQTLARIFLRDHGDRFRRTAAARNNHHARRGGLVEHVAQMMRLAASVADTYPTLNRDLLLAGVLFHDCGKLWENALPPEGFIMPFFECGELLGHITIGIEIVNGLWRKMMAQPGVEAWAKAQPASEDVRLHLLHLLAAHHGELGFGSPVVPKTPEAWALHHIDNLDAKLEMIFAGYPLAKPLGHRIFERVRPLPGNLVAPLAHFSPEAEPAPDPVREGSSDLRDHSPAPPVSELAR